MNPICLIFFLIFYNAIKRNSNMAQVLSVTMVRVERREIKLFRWYRWKMRIVQDAFHVQLSCVWNILVAWNTNMG